MQDEVSNNPGGLVWAFLGLQPRSYRINALHQATGGLGNAVQIEP